MRERRFPVIYWFVSPNVDGVVGEFATGVVAGGVDWRFVAGVVVVVDVVEWNLYKEVQELF